LEIEDARISQLVQELVQRPLCDPEVEEAAAARKEVVARKEEAAAARKEVVARKANQAKESAQAKQRQYDAATHAQHSAMQASASDTPGVTAAAGVAARRSLLATGEAVVAAQAGAAAAAAAAAREVAVAPLTTATHWSAAEPTRLGGQS
jgi:hypothetical protein